VRVDGTLGDRGVGPHLCALDELGPKELTLYRVGLALLTIGGGQDDLYHAVRVGLLQAHDAVNIGEDGFGLRVPCLEELDDAGEARRDVLAGDAAGVEGAHRKLGSRLANGPR
jgi:hypothetical protein